MLLVHLAVVPIVLVLWKFLRRLVLQGWSTLIFAMRFVRRFIRRWRFSSRPLLKLPYHARYQIYQLLVRKPNRQWRHSSMPFLKLPYDVRYQVYQLLFQESRIEVRKDNRRTCGAKVDCSNCPHYLLNTSHQIRDEIWALLESHKILVIAWKNSNNVGLQRFWANIPLHVLQSIRTLHITTQKMSSAWSELTPTMDQRHYALQATMCHALDRLVSDLVAVARRSAASGS